MIRKHPFRAIRIVVAALLLMSLSCASQAAEKKTGREDNPDAMTQAELQSQVMAFADRYFSILVAGFNAYKTQSPAAENYKELLSVCTYSVSSAFTIAAEPNPVGALLDMVAMVTLGRIIFEDNLLRRYGPQLQPLIEGFRKAEKDIWEVTANVLTPEQQQQLKAIIVDWRKNNLEVLFFPSIRLSDFSAYRTETEKKAFKGLFKSVENATQQVEEVRLLAERGMFLGTRMPQLTGLFAGVWFSQLATHPDMNKVLKDIEMFSLVFKRLAAVAEQLPGEIATERDTTIKQAMKNINELTITAIDRTSKQTMAMIDETAKRISQERKAAIRQLMDEFSAERKRTIDAFLNEDQRMRGLLTELRLTLAEGNKLVISTDSLIKDLEPKPGAEKAAAPAKPFDIKEYQDTLREASNTIMQVHELIKTLDKMGLEKMVPKLLQWIETVEKKVQRWVLFGFVLGIALILVFLIGAVIAMLVYHRYTAVQNFGSAPQRVSS